MKTACRNFSSLFVLLILVACSTDAPSEPDGETSQETPAPLPFTAAVEAGDTHYFSGWGSRNPETGEHPEGFEAQSEQLMINLLRLLERHEAGFSDILHSNLYITDATQLNAFYEIYEKYFPEQAPALTTVAIPELPDTEVELTFIASSGSEVQQVVPQSFDTSTLFLSPGILSGDYLYTSSCGGRIYRSDYAPEGDLSAQLRQCIAGLEEVLQAAGMGFSDVVKSEIFLTDLSHAQDLLEAYGSYFDDGLPVHTIAEVASLPGDIEVSVSFVAARGGEVVELEATPSKPSGSSAVQRGERLYLSGITPPPDLAIDEQVMTVMDEIEQILETIGMGFSDVVDAKVYLTDMGDYAVMNDIYGSYFKDGFPTRSCIEMSGLPGGAKVQVTLVADSRR